MSLADLGLSEAQERVYRFLLRNPRADATAAASALELPAARIVAELTDLGLIDANAAPVAPSLAVDLLVRRRIEDTRRQLTELTAAWDVVAELAEEHRSGRPVHMVEHLTDGRAVTRRMRALLHERCEEFAYTKPLAMGRYLDTYLTRFLAVGLRSRTLFTAGALADPEQEEWARYWTERGDHHRVTDEPVRHLAIVNREAAFVQADPAAPEAGALEIRQPGVVAMAMEMFEGMWSRARELDELPLSPVERQVLRALAQQDTDEIAARSLHMSVRKFRAHVAGLMNRLGAKTRFQAALLAKEQGWL